MANLPDLVLLSVFKKLDINDQLCCEQVCTNWSRLVREINKPLRCLTIYIGNKNQESEFHFYRKIDMDIFGYNANIKRQLIEESEAENREIFECSSKWNTLEFSTDGYQLNSNSTQQIFSDRLLTDHPKESLLLNFNSATVQQIISLFPNVVELNFFNTQRVDQYEFLTQMLESYQARKEQLTALRLFDQTEDSSSSSSSSKYISQRLFTAIHHLPALKHFVLEMKDTNGRGQLQLHELSVLNRLQSVRFIPKNMKDFINFCSCVQTYAAKKNDLQVDFPDKFKQMDYVELTDDRVLGHLIQERIVRNYWLPIDNLPRLQIVCKIYSRLRSLTISSCTLDKYASMFALLSEHLHDLLHLKLITGFCHGVQRLPPITYSPLPSVKALELELEYDIDFKLLPLLKLSVTLPNVQTIHFVKYSCLKNDDIYHHYDYFNSNTSSIKRNEIRQGFRAVLQDLITAFPKLSQERITFEMIDKPAISAEQFLDQLDLN